ncbi:MAG TPA: hypothetical protein VMM36_18790 [Opitutaceae bacterium]|nr:hypothetical protein [Opitutaceae bacterium]
MQLWQGIIESEDTTVATLCELYARNRDAPGFLAAVATLLEVLEEDTAWRAVWILKAAAEEGVLGVREIEIVARNLDVSRHWAARLILCQLFARVDCPEAEREILFCFLLKCFEDRRVIVRAWALSAMWRFRRDPRFRTEIERCMRAAGKDPGKAMHARLRQLTRHG